MKITKKVLGDTIYRELKPGLNRTETEALVNQFFETASNMLISGGGVVRLKNFGKFVVQHKAARRGRNPQTGESIVIPARKRVAFVLAVHLKKRMNGEDLTGTFSCSSVTPVLKQHFGMHTEQAVHLIIKTMGEGLVDGQAVEIRGFGSITLRSYDAYTGRNPKTGEPIEVPAKRLPFFKAGRKLREAVK